MIERNTAREFFGRNLGTVVRSSLRNERSPSTETPHAEDPKRAKGFSLRVSIATSFVILLMLICSVLTWYTYNRNARLMLQFADSFLDAASNSTIANTTYLLEPVRAAVGELATIGEMHPELLDQPAMLRHLLKVLESYPQTYGAYIGFEATGNFIQVVRVAPDTKTLGPNTRRIPPGTRFALRVLERTPDGTTDSYRFIESWGADTGTDRIASVTYDPRERPFYSGAVERAGPHLSDIYAFASNGEPGITISEPIYGRDGKLVGVVAADITLDSMSTFLDGQQIGKTGIAFIVDEKDRVVAFPDAEKTVRADGPDISLPTVNDLNLPFVTAAFNLRRNGMGRDFTYDWDGVDYLARFESFPQTFDKKWSIAILVPVNDFVGSLKKTTRDIIMISVLVSIMSIFAINWVALRITRPIHQVIDETKKIRRFALEGDIRVSSRITEIIQLVDAMQAMKATVQTFSRFVPRTLVQQLLASGRSLELGGQTQRLSIMFTDLAGFSQLAERLPARDLMLQISRHLDLVSRIVIDNNGTIDKFIGDATMAFWGAPLAQPDHAYFACHSALEIQARMSEANNFAEAEGLPVMNARIGIHTDTVVVGNIGSSERMSYTAIGDGVNIASRLEGINKVYGTAICVSDAVFRETGDRFLMRPIDHVAVKGRRTGITVYELMASRDDASDLAPTEQQRDIAARTTKGFFLYMDRKWEKALKTYSLAAKLYPTDPVVTKFAARCHDLVQHPPGPNWGGVVELSE
ncbi:MAG: adenylate cyclase 1 [Microvirga sp.]|nr:adenylate cyclase 1 [Microvirga sp.]